MMYTNCANKDMYIDIVKHCFTCFCQSLKRVATYVQPEPLNYCNGDLSKGASNKALCNTKNPGITD